MKNTIKLWGVIAFIAVIGFSFVSCGDDPPPELSGRYSGTYSGVGLHYTFSGFDYSSIMGTPGIYTVPVESGTYSINGNTITFNSYDVLAYTGTLSNDNRSITIHDLDTVITKN